jgi:sec-independent protein translocase protein TatA
MELWLCYNSSANKKETEMSEHIRNILSLGWPEGLDWLWILLIALLVFGGKKLPEIARSIGRSLSEFKKGIKEAEEGKDEVIDEVKKVKDDLVKETKKSSGLDEPGTSV